MSEAFYWYQSLVKPSWAPPSWIFSPVWSILYLIIFITYGMVFYDILAKKLPRKIGVPFILNLCFNIVFSPLQFGLKNNLLAAIDILLVLGTLIWAMKLIRPFKPWIVYLNIPYLSWVTFATALQLVITYMNW